MLSDEQITIKACAALDGYIGEYDNMHQMLVKIGFFQMRNSIGEAVKLLQSQIDGGEECRGRDAEITEVINVLTD